MLERIEIGIDIEMVNTFIKMSLTKTHPFTKKFFTKSEINYCFNQSNPFEHLCVRFAAKEATIKAFSKFGINLILSNKIWIENNAKGIPELFVSKKIFDKKSIKNYSNFKFSVSLTHNELIGAAIVLISI